MINPERSHHAAPEAENHLNSAQGCCPLESCTAQVSAGRLHAWIAALLHGRSGPALKRYPLSSCQHQLCPANPSGMLRGLWLSSALELGTTSCPAQARMLLTQPGAAGMPVPPEHPAKGEEERQPAQEAWEPLT